MQRQRRAVSERSSSYKEPEERVAENEEAQVLVGRRKKPPTLISHVVSSASPKDADVTRWETLAFLGFLHEFHPSFAVTIDPLALFSALTSGPKPNNATFTLIRELHLFLLRGISRGRAPVTTETWERVLHNRLRERLDELSEFKHHNPMADEEEEDESSSSEEQKGDAGAEGGTAKNPEKERPSRYFVMTTEQRVRVLYLLACWQMEQSTSIANEVAKREVGDGNGTVRLEPTGEDEKLWDTPHNPRGRWEIVCADLTELEALITLLADAQRDEKALRDVLQVVAIEPLLKEVKAREAAERRQVLDHLKVEFQAHASRHLGVNSQNIVAGSRSRRVPSYRFEDLVAGSKAFEPVLDRAARQRRREEDAATARRDRLGLGDDETDSKEDGSGSNGHMRKAALKGQQSRRAHMKRGPPQRWGKGSQSDSEGSQGSEDYGSEGEGDGDEMRKKGRSGGDDESGDQNDEEEESEEKARSYEKDDEVVFETKMKEADSTKSEPTPAAATKSASVALSAAPTEEKKSLAVSSDKAPNGVTRGDVAMKEVSNGAAIVHVGEATK